jgi:transcription antitermination factor NusG
MIEGMTSTMLSQSSIASSTGLPPGTGAHAKARGEWYAAFTLPGFEERVTRSLGQLSLEEVFLPIRTPKVGEAPELLFPNYVLFRTGVIGGIASSIEEMPGVRMILSATPGVPSSIPETEIEVVKELVRSERHPLLGALPEKGRVARIIEGPMRGVEGIVLWKNRKEARIGTQVKFVGAPCELTVPLDLLMLCEYRVPEGETHRARHRSGRRSRRSSERRGVA